MALEVFANDPTTTGGSWSTLASGYTSGATSLVITSNTKYATADPTATPPTKFRVRIDNELFVVTDNRTTTWTVAGAQGGSTAANHSSGATVTEVLTATSLVELQHVAEGRTSSGSTTAPFVVPGLRSFVSVSTMAMSANRANYYSFLVPGDITVDQLACEVTTAVASSTVRLAIYNADLSGQPTTLVVDSGDIASATTGVKTASVTANLPAGRYLFWTNVSAGGIALKTYRVVQEIAAAGAGNFINQTYVAQTYGAPPSTGLAWNSNAVSSAGMEYPVYLRRSA